MRVQHHVNLWGQSLTAIDEVGERVCAKLSVCLATIHYNIKLTVARHEGGRHGSEDSAEGLHCRIKRTAGGLLLGLSS